MICIDGYYLAEAVLYNERKDPNNKWYSFIAYRFFGDGTFIKASKFTKDKNSVKFQAFDFRIENSSFYEIRDGQLIFHLNKGMPWEEKEYLRETGSGEFKMKSGRKIKFKPW